MKSRSLLICLLLAIPAVAPGATVSRYQAAQRVPRRSGLTVSAPETTWSLMPSFGHSVRGSAPNSRRVLVSFSQNSSCGAVPSGPGPARMANRLWPAGCPEKPLFRDNPRHIPRQGYQLVRVPSSSRFTGK